MGSCLTKEEQAYIAGFLDGDGSLMLQFKKRKDTARGIRVMATICLYQDVRHEGPLLWMREKFSIGYISRRNDGITELRINGFVQVKKIIEMLLPYLRFKKIQAKAIYQACKILEKKTLRKLTENERQKICDCIYAVQENNYATRSKKSLQELHAFVGLTP